MANKFISAAQMARELNEILLKASGGNRKKMRAFLYDIQTKLGGFPHNSKERNAFIEGRLK